jgi:D-amino-acid dehydrogenase
MRVGLRPASKDGLPVIGEVPSVANVFIATAFAAIGLQLGPYSGKLAADWALGEAASVDLSTFSVARFENQ